MNTVTFLGGLLAGAVMASVFWFPIRITFVHEIVPYMAVDDGELTCAMTFDLRMYRNREVMPLQPALEFETP